MPKLHGLFRLFTRFKPAIILAAMVSLLMCGAPGCELASDSEFDPIADADTDSDQFRTMEQTAAQISVDRRFHRMLEKSVMLTEQRIVAQAETSPTDLNAFVWMMQNYPPSLEIDLDELATYAGMDPTLIHDIVALSQMLIVSYDLGDYEPYQLRSLFEMAASTPANQQYIENAIQAMFEVPGWLCEAGCTAAFVAATTAATTAYVAALAGAPILTAVLATTTYIHAMAAAEGVRSRCMDDCHGSTNECEIDADCSSTEFCFKGTLGFGTNKCKPKKGQGSLCSRHRKCISGCCKLHLLTNPFSKTCRPASACN